MVAAFTLPVPRLATMPPPEPALPDIALVQRIREGDDRALGIVYDRYVPVVLGVARSITREESDAEEVTESVFLHLWTHADDFDSARGGLRTYLALLARSRALDRVRALRRRQDAVERSAAAEPEEYAAPVSNPGSDPEHEIVRREVRDSLEELMNGLSDPQREAIELAYFGGLTQSEIAQRTETPLGTVKTRIRDGMSKLREAAGKEGLQR